MIPAIAALMLSLQAMAQSPSRPPTLVPVPLAHRPASYRLVPLGRTQRDTTSWTVTRRPAGRGTALQVMIARSNGETSVDSVLFDRRTLLPIWERLHDHDTIAVEFSGAHIRGGVTRPDSAKVPVDVTAPGFAYSSTMDNFVVQSLPLAAGYEITLPFWDGDHLELDTVRVRAPDSGAASARPATWLVDFSEPYAVETLWIDRVSRRVIRHVYTWRRDGTRSEVLAIDASDARRSGLTEARHQGSRGTGARRT